MRLALILAAVGAIGAGGVSTAVAQSDPILVPGPKHVRGTPVSQAISLDCRGVPITARWTPGEPEWRLKVGDRELTYGAEAPFVRDLFALRVQPKAFWSRCREDDFEIGVYVVNTGADRPSMAHAVVWFTYDGALAGYTGLQPEDPVVFNRRLE